MPPSVPTTAHKLRQAEERLRAAGLTGAQAFDALEAALRARLGKANSDVLPVAAEAVADLPQSLDLLGLAYERFFADLFKGRRGQYFTPPPLVRLLMAHSGIARGMRVLDPACGSGGLLQAAAKMGAWVEGIELDPRLSRLAALALDGAGQVRQGDMFTMQVEPVDCVVANPPFSVLVRDEASLARFGLVRPMLSDQLFVRALPAWVKPGGRAAIVMPTSLLMNPGMELERQLLDDAFARVAVCTLPEGVFRPFGGAAGRACLVWLRRRHAGELDLPLPVRWAELRDPGYDPRSLALKATRDDEVDRLCGGDGWSAMPAETWTPPPSSLQGRPVSELATLRRERAAVPAGATQRLDLGDVDRSTGEGRPICVPALKLGGSRWQIHKGDVLVARLRPELGNVVVAPCDAVGSPEWVVLQAPVAKHYLWLALRSEAWRGQLPLSGGQTRPRTHAKAVLDSSVPWPNDGLVHRIDALAAQLLEQRRILGERLKALELAVADFAASGDTEKLEVDVDTQESQSGPRSSPTEGDDHEAADVRSDG